jgi:general stress protein 26
MSLQKVRAIIESAEYGALATSVDGQPRVRPMAFIMLEDGRLWSSTFRQSGKVRELQSNQRVEVCFVDASKIQVRIEGFLSTEGGPDARRKLLELNPKVRRHFPDEHDKKFVHLEVVPTRIRWKPTGFNEYNEVALPSAR